MSHVHGVFLLRSFLRGAFLILLVRGVESRLQDPISHLGSRMVL